MTYFYSRPALYVDVVVDIKCIFKTLINYKANGIAPNPVLQIYYRRGKHLSEFSIDIEAT